LQNLIDSHRTLRSYNLDNREELAKQNEIIYERVAAQTREEIKHGEYISVAKLKTMSMQDICKFIYPELE